MRLGDLAHYERYNSIRTLCEDNTHKINMGGGNSMIKSKLTTTVGDYRDVEILPDSVIYIDCPYLSTEPYKGSDKSKYFDHEALYDWCERQTALVLVSEYYMPPDRFVCIAEKPRKSTFSATNNSLERIEKVFVPKHQYEMYKRMMNKNEQLTLDL